MNDDNIIEQTDRYRLLIEQDIYPDQPDYDGMGQILRTDGRQFESLHTEKGIPSLVDDWEWAWKKTGGDTEIIERYLRIFHDVVGYDTFDTQDAKYICIVTLKDLREWGFSSVAAFKATTDRDNPADGILKVWRAYVEGECYGFVIQERQRWRRIPVDKSEGAFSTIFPTERESWETVEAIGGFYGRDDVEEAGREMFATYTGKDEE